MTGLSETTPPPWVRIADGRAEIPADPLSVFAYADLIRRTEQELLRLFSEGLVAGTTHTCLGQEICQLAVVRALRHGDHILSNHRNHGHLLAYCGDFSGFLAEITARDGAICGGRGGSQHLAVGNFHSNGVQGGMTGIAAGLALGEQLAGRKQVVAVVIGDGTLGQGLVYESMNIAGIWSLPLLFVVENNEIAQTTPTASVLSGNILARGEAFALRSWRLDDSARDFVERVEEVVGWVRDMQRPGFLVIDTARLGPHSKGDDLRSEEEIARIRARDPLAALRARLDPKDATRAETVNASFLRGLSREILERPLAKGKAALPRPRVASNASAHLGEASPLTVREGLNGALRRLLTEDKTVILLGEDLHDPYGGAFKVTAGLSTRFNGRVVSTPISEACMTGAAIGLALHGYRPVLEIMFADFLSLCMDQLYNHATKIGEIKGRDAVHMVVRAPSGGRRGYGPTHSQSPEALVASIPGMTVVCPHHRLDAGCLLETAVRHAPGPILFVEHKLTYARKMDPGGYVPLPPASEDGLDRLFPTLASLRDRPDLTILTFGGMLTEVEEAVRYLEEEEELAVEVLVPSLLSPLPAAALIERIERCGKLLIVEEGPRAFGIGAEAVSRLAEAGVLKRVRRLGFEDIIIPAARHLEAEAIPGSAEIIAAALTLS
jgi:2-oxoisovalerate dehydrogenase E1 component